MTSPMVEAIATIVEAKDAEIDRLKAELEEAREALKPFASIPSVVLFPEGGLEMACHYWTVIGTPDKTHFTQSDLIRARAFLHRTE